jgi:VWFA-related protein
MKIPSVLRVGAISVIFFGCLAVSMRGSGPQALPVFRSDVRLIEVYVTVHDRNGRHVSGLARDRFEILDDGIPCVLTAFESTTTGFSCAILLDGTGSMDLVLPTVKNAILRFIGAFRENDLFALYSFNTALTTLVDYTGDKDAGKRAVLTTIAQGGTALFDSLSEVTHRLAERKGKKFVIVFTDGADNSSYLNAEAVKRMSKNAGIPVYAVAVGEALGNRELMKTLLALGQGTGGSAFEARKPSRIDEVFQNISADMRHAYLLAYTPPDSTESRWRTIQVNIKDAKGLQIRAREGYYAR